MPLGWSGENLRPRLVNFKSKDAPPSGIPTLTLFDAVKERFFYLVKLNKQNKISGR